MVRALHLSAFCGLIALCFVFLPRAEASSITQSGQLSSDNSIVEIDFATSSTQTYTFDTTSYAGGSNADGSHTAAGGFDPILTLFTSAGVFVPNGVSAGGADANFTETLGGGSYILALTEFPNFSNGTLSDYTMNYASVVGTACNTTASFVDGVTCAQLDANYTVNITSSAVTAATPEPPSALLLLLPMAGFVALNSRRQRSAGSR